MNDDDDGADTIDLTPEEVAALLAQEPRIAEVFSEPADADDIRGDTLRSAAGKSRQFSAAPDSPRRPKAAGLCVRAADTGRVLLIQRGLTDGDPAAGKWEFPGGHIDPGEDPETAAKREWHEETGSVLPPGKSAGEWTSPNGVYRGFVHEIPEESAVTINPPHGDRHTVNPDDPDGDITEVAAWHHPADLPGMPGLREEAKQTPWNVIKGASGPGD